MTEKLTAVELRVNARRGWGGKPLRVTMEFVEAELGAACIAHTRTLAQMYELSGGDWEATGPTRELHALAARIEEQSS